jgi:hypothetical protein
VRVPVRKHDALAHHAVAEVVAMHGRAVRVPVDHAPDAVPAEGLPNRRFVDVHDIHRGGSGVPAACVPCFAGHAQPLRHRQAQHCSLPGGIA